MHQHPRPRFWLEAGLAAAAALLLALTAAVPNWIERIFGVEADAGGGELEWGLAIGLAVVLLLSAFMARQEWRRATVRADR
jgi:hypothetical protein